MRFNLSEVQDRDFEAIPGGKYHVKFTGYEMRETKDKPENKLPAGTPMINWEFTVITGPGGDDTYKGRKLWMNTILHENVLFNLKGVLRACGWTDEQLNSPEGVNFEPDDVIGHEVLAQVSKREYPEGSGDYTNDVRRVSKLGDQKASESLLP